MLARPESVALLQDRVPGLGAADADRLAAQLGDLPLAVAQAAGFMAETGTACRRVPGPAANTGRTAPGPGGAGVVPAVAGRRDRADRGPARRR